MTHTDKEKKQEAGKEEVFEKNVISENVEESPSVAAEVKNAHASGLGSMGRHDEDGENKKGTLQKD